MKYRGRKKLNKEQAGEMIENTTQMLYTLLETIHYWKTQPVSKSDKLIEAMCGQTREEMIEEATKKVEYCQSKIEYARKFNPQYQIKGSYAYM